MKISARNQLKGKIVGVTKGQTTAHVRIDIGGGIIVTASITNEAVDDLALRVGDDALSVIKESVVMVAKCGDGISSALAPAQSLDWLVGRRQPRRDPLPTPPSDGSTSRMRCAGSSRRARQPH